jgi:hypothetical protein
MNRVCVILQPSYIPWRGYFHQIQKADVFVFYDCVQYDDRGWRNRNRIKTPGGLQWLSIPVHSKGVQLVATPIKDVRIVPDIPWNTKHWRTLQQNYGKAPHFKRYAPVLEKFYTRRDELLADFTCDLTVALARELGLERTRFVRSSTLPAQGTKTDRLLSLLTHLDATHYVSGPSAKDYLELDKFAAAGIRVEFMAYDYPEYPQLHGAFEPAVSILDLLFNAGPDAARFIWSKPGTPSA